jgi:hypothetical protein
MLCMTVGYFLFATHMLLSNGEGVMLGSRYYNIIGYDGSFTDLLRVALVNPALYAVESFTPEKLLYALNMLLPLALLPLMSAKPSRWLLIAPLFVMNLISDYQYQYDLGFQYSFGSGALLVYLAAINLADLFPTVQEEPASAVLAPDSVADTDEPMVIAPARPRVISGACAALLTFALMASVLLMSARLPSQSYYVRLYDSERENMARVNEVLAGIDRDKSVTATSMYLTPLYDVDELYHTSQVVGEDGYLKIFTDVVVLDLREYIPQDSKIANQFITAYLFNGYEVKTEIDGLIVVMERTDTAE